MGDSGRWFDWSIREGSRIERMPTAVQALALLMRNLDSRNWVETLETYHHRQDGMATRHNDGFIETDRFCKAYARAVSAGGFDYGIPYRIHQALWCSRHAQKVEGEFVELGTGRGFIMSAVLADYHEWASSGRELHLFDTFKRTRPDASGKQDPNGPVSSHYAESVEAVKRNFSEWPRVYIHPGDVCDTLPGFAATKVAFLHIDMNSPRPEVFGLRALWHRIPRGGVVLLDDYAFRGHEKQYEAMNELAGELGLDILSTPTGQGIIIK